MIKQTLLVTSWDVYTIKHTDFSGLETDA